MVDSAEELNQLHQYTRTNLQLVIQWWIFFVTANYVVLGIFAAKMVEGSLRSALPVYIASALFSGVNVGSIWFCFQARKWFGQVGKAVATLRVSSQTNQPNSAINPENPFPHAEYSQLLAAMTITIASMLLTWVVFAFAVAYMQSHPVNHPISSGPIFVDPW
jgi:hypothetical protein